MLANAKLIIALFALSMAGQLYAQEDSIKILLSRVLYDKKVFPEVFFSYSGFGEYPHVLAPGTYAFIFPDSVFEKHYPDIIKKLSTTWGSEKKLYTMTYLQRPDMGTVFVKSDIYSDPNLKFYITLNMIAVDGNKATVKFSTSCNCIDYENGKRVNLDIGLVRKRNGWKVKAVQVLRVIGCR